MQRQPALWLAAVCIQSTPTPPHLLAWSSTLRRGGSTLARSPSHISKNLLLLEKAINKALAHHKQHCKQDAQTEGMPLALCTAGFSLPQM